MSQDDEHRDPVELSASEFMALRRGYRPSTEELVRQNPDSANAVRDLMPVVKMLERARAEQGSRTKSKHCFPEFARPERLGEFRIGRELGRGGMGIVFEAEQETLQRTVALKVIVDQSPSDSSVDPQFREEGITTAKLHHSNIVPVYGAGRQGRYHYMAMERIIGASLHAVIQHLQRLVGDAEIYATKLPRDFAMDSPAITAHRLALMLLGVIPKTETSVDCGDDHSQKFGEDASATNVAQTLGDTYWRNVVDLVRQSASALHHAHAFQILHRDVKPGNLLLDLSGRLWVSDFGLATKFVHGENSHATVPVGTLRYMAPERFQGQCDTRSDVYSLGCTLYELVFLRSVRPHNRIAGELSIDQEHTSKIDRKIPRDLAAIIRKSMAIAPEDRYESALAFREDLVAFLEHRPVFARPIGRWEKGVRWCKRNPILAALTMFVGSSLVLIALVTSVALFLTRRAEEKVRLSLDSLTLETERANRVAAIATDALNDIFTEIAPANLTTVHTVPRNLRDSSRMSFVYSSQSVTLLQQLYQFYDQLDKESGLDHDLIARMAEAKYRIGRTCYAIGQNDQAAAAYEESVRLFRFASSIDSRRVDTFHSMVLVSLDAGDVYWNQGNYQAAVQACDQAFASLLEVTATETDSNIETAPEQQYLRAAILYRQRPRPLTGVLPPELVMAYAQQQPDAVQWQGSEQCLQDATTILRQLSQQFPEEPKFQFLLAKCLCEQSAERQLLGEFIDVSEGVQLLRNLVARYPAVANYRFSLGAALASINVSGPRFDQSNLKRIESQLWEAEDNLYSVVTEHPEILDFAETLARIDWQLGSEIELRRTRLTRSQKLFSALEIRHPDAFRFRLWRALVSIAEARFNDTAEDREKSPQLIAQAIKLIESVPATLIDSSDVLQNAKKQLSDL